MATAQMQEAKTTATRTRRSRTTADESLGPAPAPPPTLDAFYSHSPEDSVAPIHHYTTRTPSFRDIGLSALDAHIANTTGAADVVSAPTAKSPAPKKPKKKKKQRQRHATTSRVIGMPHNPYMPASVESDDDDDSDAPTSGYASSTTFMGASAPSVLSTPRSRSPILSSASEYEESEAVDVHMRDPYENLERAISSTRQHRSKSAEPEASQVRLSGVVGIQHSLSVYDFLCPHCVGGPADAAGRLVPCPHCPRPHHLSCMGHVQNVLNQALQGKSKCIQCIRPPLPPHEQILDEYVTLFGLPEPQTHGSDDDDAASDDDDDQKSRLSGLWKTYDSLCAHLRSAGLVHGLKDFVKSEDRTKRPTLDPAAAEKRGLTIQSLMEAGWSLRTIASEFGLTTLEDPRWAMLGFGKCTLLELSEQDMLFFMTHYNPHPYELRKRYRIGLPDLWHTDIKRRQRAGTGQRSSGSVTPDLDGSGDDDTTDLLNGDEVARRLENERAVSQLDASTGPSRPIGASNAICAHHGVLSPSKLAILGFDVHHMIVMGLDKTHFVQFRHFTMADWCLHLGFHKTHWPILCLAAADFRRDNIFGRLKEWNLNNLVQYRWNVSMEEMRTMQLVGHHHISDILKNNLAAPPKGFQQQQNRRRRPRRDKPSRQHAELQQQQQHHPYAPPVAYVPAHYPYIQQQQQQHQLMDRQRMYYGAYYSPHQPPGVMGYGPPLPSANTSHYGRGYHHPSHVRTTPVVPARRQLKLDPYGTRTKRRSHNT